MIVWCKYYVIVFHQNRRQTLLKSIVEKLYEDYRNENLKRDEGSSKIYIVLFKIWFYWKEYDDDNYLRVFQGVADRHSLWSR